MALSEEEQARQNQEFAKHFLRRLTGDLVGRHEDYKDLEDVLRTHFVTNDSGVFDLEESINHLVSGLSSILKEKSGFQSAEVRAGLKEAFIECLDEEVIADLRKDQDLEPEDPNSKINLASVDPDDIDLDAFAKKLSTAKIGPDEQPLAVFLATAKTNGLSAEGILKKHLSSDQTTLNVDPAVDAFMKSLKDVLAKQPGYDEGKFKEEMKKAIEDSIVYSPEDPSDPSAPKKIDLTATAKKVSEAKVGPDGQSLAVFLAMANEGYNDFQAGYLRGEYETLAGMLNMFVPGLGGMLLGTMTTDPEKTPSASSVSGADFKSMFSIQRGATGREWQRFMSDAPEPSGTSDYASWQAPSGDYGLTKDFYDGTGQYGETLLTRDGGLSVVPNADTLLQRMIATGYIKGVAADKTDPEYIALKAHAEGVSNGFDIDSVEADKIIAELQKQGILNDPADPAELADLKTYLEDQSRFQTSTTWANGLAQQLYREIQVRAPESINPAVTGGEAIGKLEKIVSPYIRANTPEEFEKRMVDYVTATPGMDMGVDHTASYGAHIVPPAGTVPSSPPVATPRLFDKVPDAVSYSHPVELGADDLDIFMDKGDIYEIDASGSFTVSMSDTDIEAFITMLNDPTPTMEAVLGEDGVADAYFISNDAGQGFYVTMAELDPAELGNVSGVGNLSKPVDPPAPPAPPPPPPPPPPPGRAPGD